MHLDLHFLGIMSNTPQKLLLLVLSHPKAFFKENLYLLCSVMSLAINTCNNNYV